MQDKFSYCEQVVSEADKDRFLACLFAPAQLRPHVLALYAFNVEIARVRELAREAMAGEVRLQWWRDALQGDARGDMRANPVADALIETIARFNLSTAPLLRLIDARTFDLYDDPMPSLVDLETYARDTSSALIDLAAAILSGSDHDLGETANHAGIAYAITGLLRAVPVHAARGQIYLPQDVLERHHVRRVDVLAGIATDGLSAVFAELRQQARQHLAELDEWRSLVPPEASPAYLPVALVPAQLARMERKDYDPFQPVELPQWRRQWILWRAARRDFPGS